MREHLVAEILLATSYHLSLDPKQQHLMKPYPPQATLLAAAVLRQVGYEVALHDSMFESGPETFSRALDQHQPRIVVLYEDSFNWLSKMCLSNMREAALNMARMAQERGAIVLVASPDANDDPGVYLAADIRGVLAGEAELTLRDAIGVLKANPKADLQDIPGMIYAHEGEVKRTRARPINEALDDLPMAAWDLLDVEPYRRAWVAKHGYFSINQITTRGCPFKCNWCAKPVYGNAYQTRSPQKVVEEMRWVKTHLKPDHFWFADDILGLKRNWLLEFADLVDSTGAALPFMCQTRVDLMTPKNVAAMAKAGCVEVWMGAESGDEAVLEAMEKGITPAQTEAAVENLKAHGIRVALFLQFGYPGERWAEINRTRAMVLRAMPDEVGISVSYPLPGTPFYERVSAQLGDKKNWRHSDDLDPLFPGAYSRDFYRLLHTMVHHEHRAHLGLHLGRRVLSAAQPPNRKELKRIASVVKHIPGFIAYRARVEWQRRLDTRRA